LGKEAHSLCDTSCRQVAIVNALPCEQELDDHAATLDYM
jgi:hypothetical protein